MAWVVLFHPEFEVEFGGLVEQVQDDLLESARVLAEIGPTPGRPTVDTLNGARHANMKEMRFTSGAAFGGWPLHLILLGRQSCLSPGTRPGRAPRCRRSSIAI